MLGSAGAGPDLRPGNTLTGTGHGRVCGQRQHSLGTPDISDRDHLPFQRASSGKHVTGHRLLAVHQGLDAVQHPLEVLDRSAVSAVPLLILSGIMLPLEQAPGWMGCPYVRSGLFVGVRTIHRNTA
jgi:hypothetical protein